MSRNINDLFVILVMLIAMAGPIYAAGSSAGGSTSSPSQPATVMNVTTQNPDCESYGTVKDRVQCRLLYGETQYSIPEPCRGLDNEQSCAQLYKDVTPCYSSTGTDKDQCLKQTAGFAAKNVDNEQNTTAIRNYVLFLLYDLQDRVETAYANQQVNADQASDIISSIVDAKYTVTRGQPVSDISSAVDIVKQKYMAVLQ